MENGYLESFKRRFGDECLNENWFCSLADAGKDRAVEAGLQRTASAQQLQLAVPYGARSAGCGLLQK
jgi:hypothetical protein